MLPTDIGAAVTLFVAAEYETVATPVSLELTVIVPSPITVTAISLFVPYVVYGVAAANVALPVA